MPKTPTGQTSDRDARLARALRENLKRRKAHGARAVATGADEHAANAPPEGHAVRESGPNPAGKVR